MARHTATVRTTHWITTLCFAALLVSGLELVVSHPRFYWGETGNVNETPLFAIPIPSSRGTVPTGYGYVLPDQNGWSRYLHFQSAWLLVFTGLVYVAAGLATSHFRADLIPERLDLADGDEWRYNSIQRLSYLVVVFVLFPLIIWTGLDMSDTFAAVFPSAVTLLGGRQSARTLHFAVTILLMLFLFVHVAMVYRAGFVTRVRAMITGRTGSRPEAS